MLATWLLRLYPRRWRERYESEVTAVLEQHRVTLKTSADLFLSALDAQLDPAYRGDGKFRPMESVKRLRSSNSTILWTFTAFILGYSLFLGDLSDVLKHVTGHQPVLVAMNSVWNSLASLQAPIVLVVALFVSGTLALRPNMGPYWFLKFVPLGLVLIPAVTLLVFWKCISGGACFAISLPAYLALMLSLPVLAFAVYRGEVSERVQRIALVPLGLVALSMGFQMVYTLAWGIVAWPTSQGTVATLALAHHVTLWPGDWHIWAVVGLALVALFGIMAIRATWRGLFTFFEKQAKPA
jgi:hypothetical protein